MGLLQTSSCLLLIGMLCGAVWAKQAWGDYWTWDPKECWAMATWMLTLIGMHLRRVAVPVRLSIDHIGQAILLCARTRPPFIGGSRAVYTQEEVR